MGDLIQDITPELSEWIDRQRVFFVATAPLAADGLLNCSPKGMDTFRVLGPRQVAYLDLTGSGIETVAHVRQNGRIVLMFCAFEGPPQIVRLHGRGDFVTPGVPEFESLLAQFSAYPGVRSIVRVQVDRVSRSCGYGVPRMAYVGERDALERWAESKGEEGLRQYRAQKNGLSIERLPGLDAE